MTLIEPLQGFFVERVWEFLPRLIARRIAPLETVASEVRIELRPLVPIEIHFGSSIPSFGMCLRITNLSLVGLKLDRLLYEVWIGQPTVKASHLEPRKIARRSVEDILLREQLTAEQQAQIRSQAKGQVVEDLTVNVTAYFESKNGPVVVKAQLPHRDVVCRGI